MFSVVVYICQLGKVFNLCCSISLLIFLFSYSITSWLMCVKFSYYDCGIFFFLYICKFGLCIFWNCAIKYKQMYKCLLDKVKPLFLWNIPLLYFYWYFSLKYTLIVLQTSLLLINVCMVYLFSYSPPSVFP